jgi:hypothetical protein
LIGITLHSLCVEQQISRSNDVAAESGASTTTAADPRRPFPFFNSSWPAAAL